MLAQPFASESSNGQSTNSSSTPAIHEKMTPQSIACAAASGNRVQNSSACSSDGEVVDGHLRLKSARKLGSWPGGDTTGVPVILCDEWTPAQVRAFRLMVNRSVSWAAWDEELLALELQELKASDFDLDLTGFDLGESDGLLALEDDERASAAPALPENPVSQDGDSSSAAV